MNHSYKVRVIIPCRNEEGYIARCLNSLINCNYPKELISIQIADGMSTDNTRKIIEYYAEKYTFIELLDNQLQSTPFALNLGLVNLDFDIGIILGAHAEIDSNFISNSVKVIESNNEIYCAGGIITNVHENLDAEIISLAMSSSFGVGNAHFRTGNYSGFVDTVAFGAYRREVFEKIGFFDEDLVRNQDDEFNYRMVKNNLKIFLSQEIKSNYFVRGSFPKLFKQYYQYGYWKVYVNKKHKAVTTKRQLVPPLWVLFVIVGLPLIFFNQVFLFGYLGLILFYLMTTIFMAIKMTYGLRKTIKLIKAFLYLHFGYGLGYLKGIIHFLMLNKKPNKKSMVLTR